MTGHTTGVTAAEQRATLAKERLMGTVHQLQAKLQPKALVREAAQAAADKGQQAAQVAKDNPLPIAGAVAVTGLFLLRHRIASLFRRKKRLTVPAQARSHSESSSDQGDHT